MEDEKLRIEELRDIAEKVRISFINFIEKLDLKSDLKAIYLNFIIYVNRLEGKTAKPSLIMSSNGDAQTWEEYIGPLDRLTNNLLNSLAE